VALCLAVPSRSQNVFLSAHAVTTANVEASLRMFIDGQSSAAVRRLEKIDASMRRSFQALPKNDQGRLTSQAARYLVHNYFAQEHGWLINGLGAHSHQRYAPDVHEADILQHKAPEILETLLHAQNSGRGFSLRDAEAMAAALERLIVDESAAMLEASYVLNNFRTDRHLSERQLREVLMSFLLMFELGTNLNVTDHETHNTLKAHMEATLGTDDSFWEKLDEFQRDTVKNYIFERRHVGNPFHAYEFTFDEAVNVVETLFHTYGRWQNSECDMMKEELISLDQHDYGRVPLRLFYSQPDAAVYKFGESVDYLRQTGALEEIPGQQPHVLISNYLAGPSNCVAGSAFYSVCCLSECAGIMSELEGKVQAPTTNASFIVDLVGSMSSTSVDGPRQLPGSLIDRLDAIAVQHEGVVPLHGRMFAQWLHYAFPLECQYPQTLASSSVLSPAHWELQGHSATEEEKEHFVSLTSDNSFMPMDESEDTQILQWSDEEVLPFQVQQPGVSYFGLARLPAQLCLLCAIVKGLAEVWKAVVRARHSFAPYPEKHFV